MHNDQFAVDGDLVGLERRDRATLLNLGSLSARAAVAAIAATTLYLALVWRPDDTPDPKPTRRWPA